MKNKFFIIISVIFAVTVYSLAIADNQAETCDQNNVCTLMTDSLTSGAATINPNTTVTLGLSVYIKDNPSPFSCPSGQGQLYHFVKHSIDGTDNNREYLSSDSGGSFTYQFGSGKSGQINNYQGIFYCNSIQITGNGKVNDIEGALGILKSQSREWQTAVFNKNTQQTSVGSGSGTGSGTGSGSGSGAGAGTSGSGAAFPRIIPDTDLMALFLRLLKYAMGVLGVLSVAMIVVGGFRMTLAQGNDEAYGAGKKTVTWAVVGLVVALMSFALIAITQNVLQADIPAATLNSN